MIRIPDDTRERIRNASRRGWRLESGERAELIERLETTVQTINDAIDLFSLDYALVALKNTKPNK